MSFITAAWHAIEVGRREASAVDAAVAAGKAGGSPLAILRAFATASGGSLEAQALNELEAGLTWAISMMHDATSVIALVVQWAPKVEGSLTDLGYNVGRVRATLKGWLEE